MTKLINKAWTKDKQEILDKLESNPDRGLFDEVAEDRLEKYGENKLQEDKKITFIGVLLHEIAEPMILLLLAVGVIYSIFGELGDAITIFVIISILVFVEIYNEYRAKKKIESLKELAIPEVTILRENRIIDIAPEQLVPGDIVFLKVGQRLSADMRIVESYGLQIDESVLTGEAIPILKDANVVLDEKTELSERKNIAYAGSTITRGKGKGVVIATGMDTELGNIAELVKSVKESKTPLQLAMKQLSLWLVGISLLFSILIPIIGILQGKDIIEMILTGLSLSFATVPEELPIIITVVLALGAYTLSKNNALLKTLRTAETLGSVTVIATDKTGTLTENKMKLNQIYSNGELVELNGNELGKTQKKILEVGTLVNNVLIKKQKGDTDYKGDPMEIALIKAAEHVDISRNNLTQEYQLENEFTFDNDRMIMSQIYKTKNSHILFLKGATEKLLERSNQIFTESGIKDLSGEDKEIILKKVDEMAEQGLRILSFAYRELQNPDITQEEAEKNLIFIGLGGFIDPPREEVKDAIQACEAAGMRVMMITGDYAETARSIAQKIGIDARKILLGKEIEDMDDEGLKGRVNYIHVFARTTPEHKLRIVNALKENGEQIAVTGDGINDAPALKKADIGIAMGETGTDVAREAADMVLLDDNFATISLAVEQGRKLYDNLKKGVRYYLAVKMALIVIFLLPIIFGIDLPFAPIQIILLELFMDLAASATFVVEPSETDVMKIVPRDPDEKFMDINMNLGIVYGALSLITAVLLVYFIFLIIPGYPSDAARTVAFVAWMVGHVFLAFNMRTIRDSLKKVGFLSNKFMIIWALGAILTMILILYIPPLQQLLRVTSIGIIEWLIVLGIAFATTFWIELGKIIRERNLE
ncbi:MAG: HAD-IC family P-type ATPase [Candidatus Lokiarchaeota archaeon]|nr:HAD-IC family P-type ATPase [Candidatus Lokiarchaeota archaeon]MBD3201078.1 HAD-IC family P-type ATPase [Candidatus Lokiarchaeota archaeon]